MWPFKTRTLEENITPIYFTNTLTGKKDLFSPMKAGIVSMYSCGPTVYGAQHIGNLRAVLFSDTIARVLTHAGYRVKRVNNITDVGHLVGDGDEGEDKMALGAKKEQTTPERIAERYTSLYLSDIQKLLVDVDAIQFPRATAYIEQQIALIQALEEKGFTYSTKDGVYFNTSQYPEYGKLGGVAEVKLMGGARIKIEDGKKNLHDFVLWRAAKPGDLQKWPSPWGVGNPGWHIECSAMIRALLGTEIDIHTGGMDHIPVHHNNEIAQSECATGKPLARFWLHEAMITMEGEKISKSLGNVVLLSDIIERGYSPLALRYFYLQASFRTPVSFSWEALKASNSALLGLYKLAAEVLAEASDRPIASATERELIALVRDDLSTAPALALLWSALKADELSPDERHSLLIAADSIFGLSLLNPPVTEDIVIPEDIQVLIQERDAARERKDYIRSDELRIHIENRGYAVEDSPTGTKVSLQTQ